MLYLVIDTNIVRGASKRTRNEFFTILDIIAQETERYGIALSDELLEEWNRERADGNPYISLYSFQWLANLQTLQRVKYVGSVAHCHHQLASIVIDPFNDEHVKNAVEEDLHLVWTAFKADRRIISHDQRIRTHLTDAARTLQGLSLILWPHFSDAPQWLHAGAPDALEYRLNGE